MCAGRDIRPSQLCAWFENLPAHSTAHKKAHHAGSSLSARIITSLRGGVKLR